MLTRRSWLKLSAAGLVGTALSTRIKFVQEAFAAYVANNTLNPLSIDKFMATLIIPPAMPLSKGSNKNKDKYDIAVRQFTQQILPSSYNPTTVWSYGSRDFPNTTFNYPALTIEATFGKDTQIQWSNELVDALGNPLPHLLPVDPSLHWANPIGARDTRPSPANGAYWSHPYLGGVNGSYIGPVPMVTHVHGAHTLEDSDGYPEAWYLPAQAANDPLITSAVGTYFDLFNTNYGHGWKPGKVSFKYPNNQRATTLWYHDHTLGMTRLNVYAGPAGFYLIRGGPDDVVLDSDTMNPAILPGPAPVVGNNPFGSGYYEIPIAIQDRAFDQDGQLWYPYYRAFFEGLGDVPDHLKIPFIPNSTLGGSASDVSPIRQPEFFGNVMVVNGVSWPYLNVEQRRYRFRFLNGCNSRFLILDFGAIPNVRVWQIGADGGFLAALVDITTDRNNRLLMSPAERADVIVDFASVPTGSHILHNIGPDEPFGGGEPPGNFDAADPNTTGQIMQFRVGRAMEEPSTPPERLILPAITPLSTNLPPRIVSLNEEESKTVLVPLNAEEEFVFDTNGTLWEVAAGEAPTESSPGVWTLARLPGIEWPEDWSPGAFGPTAALLGTVDAGGNGVPLLWMSPVTENPAAGSVEMWEIRNFTVDAHPIHIHLVQFQVVERVDEAGISRPPEPTESGFKDTVIAYPGEITRVIASFDTPGRFVWHCHIVEHEDNEMMRPYDVV
jgi:spore coat protein A